MEEEKMKCPWQWVEKSHQEYVSTPDRGYPVQVTEHTFADCLMDQCPFYHSNSVTKCQRNE